MAGRVFPPTHLCVEEAEQHSGNLLCEFQGSFLPVPNISQLGLKSADFCARLLEAEKVAAVPGIAFGADDYLRISYATSLENIEKGLDRLDRFARSLAR